MIRGRDIPRVRESNWKKIQRGSNAQIKVIPIRIGSEPYEDRFRMEWPSGTVRESVPATYVAGVLNQGRWREA